MTKKKWVGININEANQIYERQHKFYKTYVDYEDFLLILVAVEADLKQKNNQRQPQRLRAALPRSPFQFLERAQNDL